MEFLSAQAKANFHQIVLATHSPEVVRHLPANAIKVLNRNGVSGLVEISMQSCPPNVAFEAIGATFEHPTIAVEDGLAKVVVQHAIGGEPWASTLDVVVKQGGADRIWSWNVPEWAFDDRTNILVYFDGDQICPAPHSGAEIGDASVEDEVRKAFHNNAPKVTVNGGNSLTHDGEKLTALRAALDWRRSNVDFLPFLDPESFVYAHAPGAAERKSGDDIKKLWIDYVVERQAGLDSPTSAEILAMQKQVLKTIKPDVQELLSIRGRVKLFVERSAV